MGSSDEYANAHWYDLLWDRAGAPQPAVEFLLPRAQAAGQALEVGAGTGRVALRLAAAGVTLVCLEPSPAMRAVFLARLAQQPELFPRVTLLPASAAAFRLEAPVPLAYAIGVVHHFLTEAELLCALGKIHAALTPGGQLIIDAVAAQPTTQPLPPTPAGEVQIGALTYRALMWQEILAPPIHRWTFDYTILRGAEALEQNAVVSITREWLRADVERLLFAAGFTVVEVFGDYSGAPPTAASRTVVVVAQRNGER